MTKKHVEEFIKDIILPIEQNEIDSGKLYVLVPMSNPAIDLKTLAYLDYNIKEDYYYNYNADWALRSESNPGEWMKENRIYLQTLSGIIWNGSRGGIIYKAEYRGEKERLQLKDYHMFSATNKDQQMDLDAREHIDLCINQGVKVYEARLMERVTKCNPYILWSFAIDCIEHLYSQGSDYFSEIYKKGKIFARANSKFLCGKGSTELDILINSTYGKVDNRYNQSETMKDELYQLISKEIDPDISGQYIGKAILESLYLYAPFTAANMIRSGMAWLRMGEYHDEYDFPYPFNDSHNDQMMIKRIWDTFHKEELDWQTNYFKEMIGE